MLARSLVRLIINGLNGFFVVLISTNFIQDIKFHSFIFKLYVG